MSLARVRVVAITDRRHVDDLVPRIRALLAAAPRGAIAVQVRDKDLDGRALLALVHSILEVARPFDAPVWVNDRVDVALAAGADGVHLPERGLSISDARAVISTSTAGSAAHTMMIGGSRHTADDALAAAHDGADLVQLGPIWAVPDKPTPLGLDALAVRARLPRSARLVAVGGIDSATRAHDCAYAGADAVAVIRAAWRDDGPATVAAFVEAIDAGGAARAR